MRVAHSLLVGDGVRADNGITIVERSVVVAIRAEGKAYLLLPGGVTVEISKKVAYIGFVTVFFLAAAHEACCCHGGQKAQNERFVFHKIIINSGSYVCFIRYG